MRISRFLGAMAVALLLLVLTGSASAQHAAAAPGMGAMPGMPSFSPVTGAPQMAGGMSAQQQMAQIYMLYGMMGGMGSGNVRTGVADPFANGGFGAGSQPYLDSSSPADYSASGKHGAAKSGSAAKRAELRAQRAEQKKQAKQAKAPHVKPASKTNRKQNAQQQ